AEHRERLSGYGADIAMAQKNTHPNADGFSPMVLTGTTYAEKKEAGSALLALCHNMLTPDATTVGSYRGFPLELCFDSFSQEYRLTMLGALRNPVPLGTDIFGNLQRLDNALETLPVKEQSCRERLEELGKQLETAKEEVQRPFSKEEELTRKLTRLEELNALLNMDGKDDPDKEKNEEKPKITEQER
ncbi:MAG: helicase, partial [Oscillospiraceae bacterium]